MQLLLTSVNYLVVGLYDSCVTDSAPFFFSAECGDSFYSPCVSTYLFCEFSCVLPCMLVRCYCVYHSEADVTLEEV
jgi:hypothetical protein